MSAPRGLAALALALAAVALLALAPRTAPGLARPRGPTPQDGWFSLDPDGLYHTRRVARAFEEGLPIAERDPYLDFPRGAPIPWPPYYDTALYLLLAPFAPTELQERRAFLERGVATLPVAFGVLTAVAAALAGWRLARAAAGPWRRAAAAAFAGVYAAGGWGAVNYGRLGAGDHHAWVGLLHALSLLAACVAFESALRSTRKGLAWGALCGLLAGLMLGSWVASLLYVALAQLALGWLLVRRAREDLPGVAPFGLAYHAVALAAIAPAVLASPWKDELPWMVVNLSWFHLAWLAAGLAVFVPPFVLGRGPLATGGRAALVYPFAAAAALAAAGAFLWATDAAPARGVAEGLAWVSRADAFMASVRESAPLVGPRAAPGELLLALGAGVFLVPLAWGAATWRALRHGADVLLPWVAATPVLLVQALAQKRFSDAAGVPVAVLLAWAAVPLLARVPSRSALPVALVLALGAHFASVARSVPLLARGTPPGWGGPTDAVLGERTAIEWMRAPRDTHEAGAVLAHWDRGHVIEWAADRPTVATNFGSYVGERSYRDPADFFLLTDPAAAQALLEARRVRYVFAPVSLPRYTASMCAIAGLPRSLFLAGSGSPTSRWRRTMLARLIADGRAPLAPGDTPGAGDGPLGFLRLVHASTRANPGYPSTATGRPRPAAFVWERVAGAVLEWRGAPQTELRVTLELDYAPAAYTLRWEKVARADASGTARLRVPYATDAPNGDGLVRRATWSAAGPARPLAVPAAAVASGTTLELQ